MPMSLFVNAATAIMSRPSAKTANVDNPVVVKEEPIGSLNGYGFLDEDDDVIVCDPAEFENGRPKIMVKEEQPDESGDLLLLEPLATRAAPSSSSNSICRSDTCVDAVMDVDGDDWHSIPKFTPDSQSMILDRTFELDEFNMKTPFRNTELVVGCDSDGTSKSRTFFVNLEYLSEVSEYFHTLRRDNISNTKRLRITIAEESPDAFLTFLRAIVPNPLFLKVDDFNVVDLADLSLSYGVPHLFGECEKYVSDNLNALEEDVLLSIFKIIYRSDPAEQSWLYVQLFDYVAKNVAVEQIDIMMKDMGADLSYALLRIKYGVMTKELNESRVANAGEDEDSRPSKGGRKRGALPDQPAGGKRLKPEKTAACQRCIQGLKSKHPDVKYVSVLCSSCKRPCCIKDCISAVTCQDGSSCYDKRMTSDLNSSSISRTEDDTIPSPARTTQNVPSPSRNTRTILKPKGVQKSAMVLESNSSASPGSIVTLADALSENGNAPHVYQRTAQLSQGTVVRTGVQLPVREVGLSIAQSFHPSKPLTPRSSQLVRSVMRSGTENEQSLQKLFKK